MGRSARQPVDLEVIIPALDEERRLASTLSRTLQYLAGQPYTSAVVVVDNGSVDRTVDRVRRAMGGPVPLYVIGCARSGKGSAVRRGFSTGRSRYVGFMDADLATPIETLDRVMPLLRSGVATVIGSRYTAGAQLVVCQGLVRRMGGGAFRVAARTVVPTVADSQCGFKFFSGPRVRAVLGGCEVDGFSFDLELLVRMLGAGHEVVEVPVTWTDAAGSTFRPLRHGWGCFRDTVRLHRRLTRGPLLRCVAARPDGVATVPPDRAPDAEHMWGVSA